MSSGEGKPKQLENRAPPQKARTPQGRADRVPHSLLADPTQRTSHKPALSRLLTRLNRALDNPNPNPNPNPNQGPRSSSATSSRSTRSR
eukprot:scaffold78269_cov36-Phaeocystis_antarctica.AAC.1